MRDWLLLGRGWGSRAVSSNVGVGVWSKAAADDTLGKAEWWRKGERRKKGGRVIYQPNNLFNQRVLVSFPPLPLFLIQFLYPVETKHPLRRAS